MAKPRRHSKKPNRSKNRGSAINIKTLSGYCPVCKSNEIGRNYKVTEGNIGAEGVCKKCGHTWPV